jgi:hypothetical protein
MEKSPLPLWVIFLVNVGASYAPAVFWVPALPGVRKAWVFLFSQIALALLEYDVTSLLTCSVALCGLLLAVFLLSAICCRRRLVSLGLLTFLFAISLLQGVMVYGLLIGLDAIGRT